jgi:hypothetical protein
MGVQGADAQTAFDIGRVRHSVEEVQEILALKLEEPLAIGAGVLDDPDEIGVGKLLVIKVCEELAGDADRPGRSDASSSASCCVNPRPPDDRDLAIREADLSCQRCWIERVHAARRPIAKIIPQALHATQ